VTTPRLVAVVVDGLPRDPLERALPSLPFISSRLPHRSNTIGEFVAIGLVKVAGRSGPRTS
jgi:hypothetical protein